MKKYIRIILIILSTAALLVLIPPACIFLGTCGRVYHAEEVPEVYEYAIVPGASVVNGRLSHMLEDRMKTAVYLYKNGKAKKLLLSGDYESEDYNEVGAMKRYALENGVAEEDILLDYSGFSTYETVSRAKKLFGINRAVIVTQRYHLYRAIYIGRSFGMDVIGADAAIRSYHGQVARNMREILALDKDFLLCLFD
ncbi:MAG: vancomycin high temperature exclusion protein [Eubacteriales bacterium]